ncbi:MAG TPA: hypothetical protein VI111_10860 [Thermoleophilaceae bacterium]
MPPSKLIIGGAGAAAVVGIRLARSLHGRWHQLPAAARAQLEPLAEDAKRRALELRGSTDREEATADLQAANETLAAALVETAEANPDVSPDDVTQLRDDLRRELERLANADVKASRTGLPTKPPG